MLLFNSQTMVRGLLNVLLVVAAIELLGMGEAGFGWLNAALGAGALAGGLAAVGLVARRKLAGIFGIALVLWGAPIALVGAWPRAGWALVCLGIVGIGNALLDVSGFTLLQRTVDEHVLGRVFGVFEIGVAVAVALGSLLGSILVEQLGIRTALVVTGAILPFLALLSLPGLRRIDASVEVPERELELVSEVPLFSLLPPTTLERLAARLERLDVAAGTTVVEQGAAGDRFYLVAGGEIDVVLDGVTMSTLRAGEYFGEIALLHDVPRTATCTARTDAEIYALGRDVFVAAVSGDARSSAEAESVMSRRLEEQSRPRTTVRQPSSAANPSSATPDTTSTTTSSRSPTRRRATDSASDSARNHENVPMATPATSAEAVKPEPTRSAVDAAVKIAAQEAIVIGLDAVAASDVRNARRGVETSSGNLAAEPDAERAPERPRAEVRKEGRADEAEGDAEGVDLEQRARAEHAERGVERVDHRRPGADGDADRRGSAQHRSRAEQPDRPDLRGDEEPEPEAGGEGGRHYAELHAGERTRTRGLGPLPKALGPTGPNAASASSVHARMPQG